MKLRNCRACNRPRRHANNRQAPPTSKLTRGNILAGQSAPAPETRGFWESNLEPTVSHGEKSRSLTRCVRVVGMRTPPNAGDSRQTEGVTGSHQNWLTPTFTNCCYPRIEWSLLPLVFNTPRLGGLCNDLSLSDRQRDRGGYREPPEPAEGGNKGSSGTEGNHRKTGREAKRPPHSSSGGQLGPKASNQQPNHCSKAQH